MENPLSPCFASPAHVLPSIAFLASTAVMTHECLPFFGVQPASMDAVKRNIFRMANGRPSLCWMDTLLSEDEQERLQECISSEAFTSQCVVNYIIENADGNSPVHRDLKAVLKNLTGRRSRKLFMFGWSKQELIMWSNSTVSRNIARAAFGAGWEDELRAMVADVQGVEFVERVLTELDTAEQEERLRHVTTICALVRNGFSQDVCRMIVPPTRQEVPLAILPPYVCIKSCAKESVESKWWDRMGEVLNGDVDGAETSSDDEDDEDDEDEEEEEDEWHDDDDEGMYYDSSEETCPLAI